MANENRRYAPDPYRRGSSEDYPGEDRGGWFRRFRGGNYNRDASFYGRGRDYERMWDGGYGRGESVPDRGYALERDYEESARRGYEGEGAEYGAYERDQAGEGVHGERGMWDRMPDEASSWYDEIERRREVNYRGRGPRGYVRSSERIREDVCDRLTEDRWVDASNIEVEISGTEVTLSGTVESRGQRRRAEDCAESVTGVTHVQNNLRVADPNQGARPATSQGHQSGTSTNANDATANPRANTSRWT